MANNCYYEAKIVTQNEKDACDFMEAWKNAGRIFSAEIVEPVHNENGVFSASFYGDCAWSLLSAVGESKISELCEKYNCSFEAFTEEYGCCFEEHALFSPTGGNIDCVDAYFFFNDEMTRNEAVKFAKEHGFNDLQIVDGNYHIGGYQKEYEI